MIYGVSSKRGIFNLNKDHVLKQRKDLQVNSLDNLTPLLSYSPTKNDKEDLLSHFKSKMLEKLNNELTITNMAESLDMKQQVDEPLTTKRNLWFLIERLRESQENK